MAETDMMRAPYLRSPWAWAVPLGAAGAMLMVWLSDSNPPLFLLFNALSQYTGSWLWANITTLGDSLVVFSLALLLVGRRPDWVWKLLFAACLATLVVHGLKEWTLMMRPPAVFAAEEIHIIGTPHRAVSFPSGHTTAAFTFVSLFCLQRTTRLYLKWLLFLTACLVGISRMAVGVHWPLDVLGGMVIGWSSMLLSFWFAPRIPWGTTLGAQRLFAILLVGAALALIFFHDSGYSQARALEMAIGLAVLALSFKRLKQLFRHRPGKTVVSELAADEQAGARGRPRWGLALRAAVTLLVFALIFRSVDLGAVAATFKEIVPRLLLFGVLFQLLSTVLAAYRWYLVMQPLGFGERFGFYLRSYFKGAFFNQGLPTSIGGDAVRVLDVAGRGFKKREAFYGVFIDRVLGLTGLLVLNLAANALNPNLLPSGVFVTINFIVVGGLVGFVGLWLVRHLRWTAGVPLLSLFNTISNRLGQVLDNGRSSAIQLGLSLAVHLLSLIAIFLIGRSVELEYDLATFLVIVPPVILLTLVPISVAGWGVREGAMIGLFTLIGADKTLVVSMSILYGVVLIIASLPGFYVYLAGKHRL